MIYSTIDSIVRKSVFDHGYSIHWYLPFLSFALEAISELNLDVDGAVKSAELNVDELGLAKLPCNYVDWVRVGKRDGQYFNRYYSNGSFSRMLPMTDGVVSPPSSPTSNDIYGFNTLFYNNYNSNGEFTAGWFGNGEGASNEVFQILPELKAVRFHINQADSVVEMDYITWEPVNASTMVHKYAEASILAFLAYKWARKNKYNDADRLHRIYGNEVTKYRGRLNPMQAIDYAAAVRRHFKQTPRL